MSNAGDHQAQTSKEPDANHSSDEKSRIRKSGVTVVELLDELRRRIIISLVAILAGFFAAFYFSGILIKLVIYPYGPDFHPIVLEPTERIMNYFRVSMAAGLIAASPVIIGQIWGFIAPALLPHERKYAVPVLPVIVFLFAIGAAFGYFVVLPTALKFLLGFGGEFITNQIRLDRAVSFVVQICLACGLVFQLPVIILLLSKVGLITDSFLRRKRKIAIIVILVLAAAVTPTPDPLTMTLVASPMLILYEISIFIARWARPSMKPG